MENKKGGFSQLLQIGILLNVVLLVLTGFILYKVKVIKEEVKQIKSIVLWQYGGDYELAKSFFESEQFKKQAQEGIKQALKSMGIELSGSEAPSEAQPPEQAQVEPQPQEAQNEPRPNPKDLVELKPSGPADDVVAAIKQKLEQRFPQGGFRAGVLSPDQLKEVLQTTHIKGNSNAPVVWLEFSDLQCPYCARLHNQGTVKQVLDKYGNNLAYGLKHFPLGFHEHALPAAQILECVAEKVGTGVFYQLEEGTFATKNPSAENMYNLLKQYGLTDQQIAEIKACAQNREQNQRVVLNYQQGGDIFGVRGTPGNVIIDTRTGRWILIPGAYPAQAFEIVIDSFLNGDNQ